LREILEVDPLLCPTCRVEPKIVAVLTKPRAVQPPEVGQVVEIREAGGLYRHHERAAA
jgi:hypothetical protein